MNASPDQIRQLEQWLEERLGHLALHAERTAQVLQATGGVPTPANAKAIIRFAAEVVSGEAPIPKPLTPAQASTWKALLPLLAEHGSLLAGVSTIPETEATLDKKEAAKLIGFSVRKLEKHMHRREVAYQKFGTGQAATVRFRKSDLVLFMNRRTVVARQDSR